MKKWTIGILGVVILTFIITMNFGPMGMGGEASACGGSWGASGGGDFGPQGRELKANSAPTEGLTRGQAYGIIIDYLATIGPDLQIGSVNDGGVFWAFEITAENKLVDRLAVDKGTGQVRVLS